MVKPQRCNPASQSGSSHSKGAPPPHPPHPPNNRTANTDTNMPPLPCMGGGVCVWRGVGGAGGEEPRGPPLPKQPRIARRRPW